LCDDGWFKIVSSLLHGDLSNPVLFKKILSKTGKRCTEYCLILLKKQRNHGNIIRTIAVSALSFACRKKTAGGF
jgi:hypothetical protein